MLVWIRGKLIYSYIGKTVLGVSTIVLIFLMLQFSQDSFAAALRGLYAWWEIVLPSLLPFFVASELLMSLGIVHFLGILLEPVMRPLFNIPGSGAFIISLSFISGAPIGASFTAKLRKNRLCTRLEAEKLIAFTNNTSPLFMFVAVAVGMFGIPALGAIIASAHYLANLLLGLCLRFYGTKERKIKFKKSGNIFSEAWKIMLDIQKKDQRPLGKLLSEALKNSIAKLSLIGGYIILFSVIITLVEKTGLFTPLNNLLQFTLSLFGIEALSVHALTAGLVEATIGCKMAAETDASLFERVCIVGAILGWSGLSIHAQVASMISETDIRMRIYIIARICQAILAALFSALFLKLFFSAAAMSTVSTTASFLRWYELLCYKIPLIVLVFALLLTGLIFLFSPAKNYHKSWK